jgi:hypothetical protein
MMIDVGGVAVAGVLLVGAVIVQLLVQLMDRRGRREGDKLMDIRRFMTSSVMITIVNAMISFAPAVASTGSSRQYQWR